MLAGKEKKSSKKDSEAWKQAAQSSGGSSLHGVIHRLKGQVPKQPDLFCSRFCCPA